MTNIYLGLDVGKTNHHATALTTTGKKIWDKPLPQSEPKIRELLEKLNGQGTVLLVVDQPKTIGALPVAIAQDMGIQVAYLPGLTMRRVADLHPGEAKTDARDAFIIAETARTMPHTLHTITVTEETTAELSMLCGFDDDLAANATAISNRLRGFLTQIQPHLERSLGPRLSHSAVLKLLKKYPAPADLKIAGKTKVRNLLKKNASRLTEEIFLTLGEQTVVVAGTAIVTPIISALVVQLELLLTQRAQTEQQILALVEAHPLSAVIRSMPGMGVRTSARILTEVVGKDFKDASHLASYAGIAPVDRKSGTSIKRTQASRRGNKAFKRVLFLSAFDSLKVDQASRRYYDRKCAEGKRHNQAIMALARKRLNVLFAMLRDGCFYECRVPVGT